MYNTDNESVAGQGRGRHEDGEGAVARICAAWPVPEHFALFENGGGDEIFRGLAAAVVSAAERDLDRTGLFSRTPDEMAAAYGAGRVVLLQAREGSIRLLSLAEAHLLTGEGRFAEKCLELLQAYLALDWFQGEYDLGIQIWFIGLLPAASWLLQSPSDRIRDLAGGLVRPLVRRVHRCAEYEFGFVKEVRDGITLGFNQNHALIAACGLGQAALILEEPEGQGFLLRGHRHFSDGEPFVLEGAEGRGPLDYALRLVENYLFVSHKLGPDGDWFEASPQYQFLWLDFVICLADACRAARGIDLYRRSKLRKAFEAFLHYSCPDGAFLDFNDSCATIPPFLLPVLARAAYEYRDAGLAWLLMRAGDISQPEQLSPRGLVNLVRYYDPERMPEPARPEVPPDAHLHLTGHVISRSGWEREAHFFALNGGSLGPHAHIDRGTFTFYYRGRPVMVDTGRGSYVNRYDFVLAEKHNVVFAEPGVVFERWGEGWGNNRLPYDAKVRRFLTNKEMTFAEVDVCGMATCRSALRRAFFSKTGYLVIVDELEDDRERTFRAIYHGVGTLEQNEGKAIWRQPGGLTTELHLLAPTEAEWTTGVHPVFGRTGVDEQAYVEFRCRGQRAWIVVFVFPRADDADGRFEVIETGRRNVLRTSRDSEVDTWIIKDDRELTRYGGIETDARVTWIRERDGTIAAWGVVDGWRVRWGGDDLLSGRVQLAKSRTLLVAVNPHEENLCNSR